MNDGQSNSQVLDSIVVVLNRPQEAVNIGAVIRAMKNMGITDLRLVQPEAFASTDLLRVAHRCDDIVEQMTIHNSLDEALADTIYVVGTAALTHHKRPVTANIRALATDLHTKSQGGKVALLFGQEDDGLDNQALDRCHLIAMLPSNPAYPALNVAQSVLLFLYEIRMAAIPAPIEAESTIEVPASQAELEQIIQHNEAILTTIDFFRYNPAAVMRSLRQMLYRAQLSTPEARLLMAILRKVRQALAANEHNPEARS